jgi:raffinose/stachyose/melibiose transport system substrate-binding protein
MLENCRFGGRLYTLPTVTFVANLYCNTDIFSKAGAELPTDWDSLVNAVKKIRKAGYTPIALGEKENWTGMYWYDILAMRCAGSDEVKKAIDQPEKFREDRFLEAAEKLHELASLGAFSDDMMSMNCGDMLGEMAAGKSAMIYQGNWANPALNDKSAVAKNVICIPFPAIRDDTGSKKEFQGGCSDGYFLNNRCSHKEEAAQLMKIISCNTAVRGYQNGLGIPCWKTDRSSASGLTDLDIQSMDILKDANTYLPWWDVIMDSNRSESYKKLVARLLTLELSPKEFTYQLSHLQ